MTSLSFYSTKTSNDEYSLSQIFNTIDLSFLDVNKNSEDLPTSSNPHSESAVLDSSATNSTILSTPESTTRSYRFDNAMVNELNDSSIYPAYTSNNNNNVVASFNSHQQNMLKNNCIFPIIDNTRQLSNIHCNMNRKSINPIKIRPWLQFGGYGSTNSNFTEPNSVVLSPQGYIIIADTNSHHIKIFDGEGRFLYKFGEAGKSHGKMLYPCKIDMLPNSVASYQNRLVIVQRNPMPQIQIFKTDGQYEHRFATNILKFPRAMCVDETGCIIIIESKVMTCHMFSPDGRYLKKLHLQNDLSFPFDICAYKNEIFISDNQAHCVKVFDYKGKLRRKIGEGVVKFPVCLDHCPVKKSIFITDNHERFNVNQFCLSDGKLLNSFYSGIKHAQCYDVTTRCNDMVLASKDYRIYRYKLPNSRSENGL